MFHVGNERDAKRDPSTHRSRPAGFWIACILMSVSVYIGSIGPAFSITNFQLNGYLSRSSFSSRSQLICETIYWPIICICERSEKLSNSMSWYLSFWQRDHKSSSVSTPTGSSKSASRSRSSETLTPTPDPNH